MTGGIGELRSREIQAGVNTGFPLCSSTLKAIIEPFGAAPFTVEPFKFESSGPQTGASTHRTASGSVQLQMPPQTSAAIRAV